MIEQSGSSIERLVPLIEKIFEGRIVLLLLAVLLAGNVLAFRLAGTSVVNVDWAVLSAKPALMLAGVVAVGTFMAWITPIICLLLLQVVSATLLSDWTPKWIAWLLVPDVPSLVEDWERGYVLPEDVRKRAIQDKDAFWMARYEAHEAASAQKQTEYWQIIHNILACCVLFSVDISAGDQSIVCALASFLSVKITDPVRDQSVVALVAWASWFWLALSRTDRDLMYHPEIANEHLKSRQANLSKADEMRQSVGINS